ncbi:MAG: shikimate dehydrogenase [Burkholderiaceae bacterium]|nr:shikimate dehydrogenase [Burkholderiaceae bacterium]
MFVLFEEDGGFKVGSLFSEADATIQVEMPSGKRSKIKRQSVLLMFQRPGRDELLPAAQRIAEGLDAQFLWECAPPEEFDFQEFAKEVFSAQPRAEESAGLLMALHQAPMYFYRKGRGRYRAAPEESLKAALAGAERKRLAAIAQQAMHDALVAGDVPPEIASSAVQLLIRPDKQSITYKALESAAQELQMTAARLLLSRGAISSVYVLHRARFMQQCFPAGTGFAIAEEDLAVAVAQANRLQLPEAPSPAYSIDDVTTTEIDDAFSLVALEDGGWRVGIHIAAPGAGITPESPLGRLARERASTVYFPGDKITMLPEPVIAAYSLDEGGSRPALSLYVDFNAQGERIATQSRLERVPIAANLRLGEWEKALDQPLESINADQLPWPGIKPMLAIAHKLRAGREAVRGRPEPSGRTDFNFYVDWNAANPDALMQGDGMPRIVERRRGSPVDVLVSEFMILANTVWGDMLALARLPGVYRVQTVGRVRLQTQPGPHQGLGVANYAWSTSPLRRYSDLLNQWQMLAVLGHRQAVFKGNEAELFSSVTQFDTLYNQYGDFQETIERYWAQRWLAIIHGLGNKESWSAMAAGVSIRERAVALREGAFRLRRAPIICRCADAPELTPGVEVELDVLAVDALDLSLQARFVSVTSTEPMMEEEPLMLARHYAVLGDPIGHSRSPTIHAMFAQQTGEDLDYQAIRVPAEQLAADIDRLIAEGFGGVNLTVPLKEHAFAMAQSRDWEISSRGLAACAINTLRFDGGEVFADNTDGIGLVRDIERLLGAAGSLDDARVLLLGAGGAAQGVIAPLREAGVRHILIANRSLDKAQAVAQRWAEVDATSAQWLSVAPLELLADPPGDEAEDILINATSASLASAALPIHPLRFARARLVFDMMYGPSATSFMQQARQAGAAHVADGLGMLVEQAAEAFFLWRGVRPETASVLAQLRLQLAATQ